jgi:molecular chaperone GrpE
MPKTAKSNQIINELQDQLKVVDENWKRALADYQNLLRRVDTDKKEFVKMSNANLIARLLPSLDILEMAAQHTQDIGVQMASKQFRTALDEEGLQVIDPQSDDVYDHNFHECTETLPTEDTSKNNTIAEIVLKGYKIGDYILRPARVKVYKNI